MPVYVPAMATNYPSIRVQSILLQAVRFERELAEAMRSKTPRSHRCVYAIQADMDSAMADAIRYDR